MSAGRVRHWKHGWIPISPQAKAYVAGTGPKPSTNASSGASVADIEKLLRPVGEKVHRFHDDDGRNTAVVPGAPDVRMVNPPGYGGRALASNDFPEVHMTTAQQAQVAAMVQHVVDDFPGLKKRPVKVDMTDTGETAWGVTNPVSSNVSVDRALFNDAKVIQGRNDFRDHHGAIAGQAKSAEEFRKMTIVHELGHTMHVRAEDEAGDDFGGWFASNKVSQLTDSLVTPRSMGWTDGDDTLDNKFPRWMADTLGKRSAYASSNRYEWFAEAFLDGYTNGDQASDGGKKALAVAKELYGK